MKHGLRDFQQALLDAYRDTSRMRSDEDDFVIRQWGEGSGGQDYHLVLKEPAPDYGQLVRDEREILLSRDKGAAWWKVHDFPAGTRGELEKALLPEGFKFLRKTRLLYMPLDQRVMPASSIETRKLLPSDPIDLVRDISLEVWGNVSETLLDQLQAAVRQPEPATHVYFSRIKGETEWASVGWVTFAAKMAFLFGGSTREKFRSMGTYRTLVSARLEEAAKAGMHFAMSECTPDSERVLRGLGFQDAGVATVFEFKAAHHAEFRKKLNNEC